FYQRKKSRLVVSIKVEGAVVKGVLFNRAFAKKHFVPGETVTVNGKWDQHRLQITIDNYQQGEIKEDNPITPIYSSKGDIKNNQLKKIMLSAMADFQNNSPEILPNQYLTNYKLPIRQEAVKQIHFPTTFSLLKHAKRRFLYDELLLFQLKI